MSKGLDADSCWTSTRDKGFTRKTGELGSWGRPHLQLRPCHDPILQKAACHMGSPAHSRAAVRLRHFGRGELSSVGTSTIGCRVHRDIGIVIEEADESEYWLELVKASRIDESDARAKLAKEAGEVRAIFVASRKTAIQTAERRKAAIKPSPQLHPFATSFAQESFSVTVRLKTSAPGRESGSTQKYPSRSN